MKGLTVGQLRALLAEYPDKARVYFEPPDNTGAYQVTDTSQFIPKPWGGWLTLTGQEDR